MRNQRGDAEAFFVIVGVLFFIGVFVGGLFIASHFYSKYQCDNYAEITGKKTRFAAFDICYIQTAEGWQRWDEYLKRSAASEGLKDLAK